MRSINWLLPAAAVLMPLAASAQMNDAAYCKALTQKYEIYISNMSVGRSPGAGTVDGNVATVAAFDALGRSCTVFIGHDLDHDNTRLLRDRRLSAVLHHDLNVDMRRACQIIMQAHKALPGPIVVWPSSFHVITPYNVPGRPAL